MQVAGYLELSLRLILDTLVKEGTTGGESEEAVGEVSERLTWVSRFYHLKLRY